MDASRLSTVTTLRFVALLVCAIVFFVFDRTSFGRYRDIESNLKIVGVQNSVQYASKSVDPHNSSKDGPKVDPTDNPGDDTKEQSKDDSEDIPDNFQIDSSFFKLNESSIDAAIQWRDYDDAIVYCDVETGHSYRAIEDARNNILSGLNAHAFEAVWEYFQDEEILDELMSHPAWLTHGQDWIRRQYRWLQSMRHRHVEATNDIGKDDPALLGPHPEFATPSKQKLSIFDETKHFATKRNAQGDAKAHTTDNEVKEADKASVWGWPFGYLHPLPSVSITGVAISDVLGFKEAPTASEFKDGTANLRPALKKSLLRMLVAQAIGLGPNNTPLFGPIQAFLQPDSHLAPSRLLKKEPLYYNKHALPYEPYLSPRFAFRLSHKAQSILHANEVSYIAEAAERSCAELHTNFVHSVIESVANAVSSLKELLAADGSGRSPGGLPFCHSDYDASTAYVSRAPWAKDRPPLRSMSGEDNWDASMSSSTTSKSDNADIILEDPFAYLEQFLSKQPDTKDPELQREEQRTTFISTVATRTSPASTSFAPSGHPNSSPSSSVPFTTSPPTAPTSPYRKLQYSHGPSHPVVMAKYVYLDVAASDTLALGNCTQPFGTQSTSGTEHKPSQWGRKQMEGPDCREKRHPQFHDMPLPYLGMSEAYTLVMDLPSLAAPSSKSDTTHYFVHGKLGAQVHIEATSHTLWGCLHAIKRVQQLLMPWGVLRKSVPMPDPTRLVVSATWITHFTPYAHDAFLAVAARLWDDNQNKNGVHSPTNKDAVTTAETIVRALRSLEGHPLVKLATVAGMTASTEIRDHCLFNTDLLVVPNERKVRRLFTEMTNNEKEDKGSDTDMSEKDLATNPLRRLRSESAAEHVDSPAARQRRLLSDAASESALAQLSALFATLTIPDRRFSSISAVLPIRLPLLVLDRPMKPWRGLSYDTARHYSPIPTLQTVLDLLSHSHDNTFHWHIADAQSFPLVLPSLPHLSEAGKWNDGLVYSADDARELVLYAAKRGIRVVPEIDMPAHTAVWGKAVPELIVDCSAGKKGDLKFMDKFALDPSIDATYELIDTMFHDLAQIFPDSHLHIGADEVVPECWAKDENLRKFATVELKHLYDQVDEWYPSHKMYVTLLSYFITRVTRIADSHGRNQMSWEDSFARISVHHQVDANVTDLLWEPEAPWPPEASSESPDFVHYPTHVALQAWKCWESIGNSVLLKGLHEGLVEDLARTMKQIKQLNNTNSTPTVPSKHFFPPVSRLYDSASELDPSEWPTNWWQFLAMHRAGGRGLINSSCWYLDWDSTWADYYTLWPMYMEDGNWEELAQITQQHYNLFDAVFELGSESSEVETEKELTVTRAPTPPSPSPPPSIEGTLSEGHRVVAASDTTKVSLTEALYAPHPFWGGEAALWMEHVDATNVFCRLFPRKLGMADMLWSESATFDRMMRMSHKQKGERIPLPITRDTYYSAQTLFAAPRILHHTRQLLRMGVPVHTLAVFDMHTELGSFVTRLPKPAYQSNEDFYPQNGKCPSIGQEVQRDKARLEELLATQLKHARRHFEPKAGQAVSFVGDLFERAAELQDKQSKGEEIQPGRESKQGKRSPSFILWNIQDGGGDRIYNIFKYLRMQDVDILAIVEANKWDIERDFGVFEKFLKSPNRRLEAEANATIPNASNTSSTNTNNNVPPTGAFDNWRSNAPQSLSQSDPWMDSFSSALHDGDGAKLQETLATAASALRIASHVTITTEEQSPAGSVRIRQLASGNPLDLTFPIQYMGGILGYPYTHIHISPSTYNIVIHSVFPISAIVDEGPYFSRGMFAADIQGVRYLLAHLHAQSARQRAIEAAHLATLVQKYTDRGIPSVVMGDLNTLSPADVPCHARDHLVTTVTRPTAPKHLRGKYLCSSGVLTHLKNDKDYSPDMIFTSNDDESCAHQFTDALFHAMNVHDAAVDDLDALREQFLNATTTLVPDYRPFLLLTNLSLPLPSTASQPFASNASTPPLTDLFLRTLNRRGDIGQKNSGFEHYDCPASYPTQTIYNIVAKAVGDEEFRPSSNDNGNIAMRLDYALANGAYLARYPDVQCEVVGWISQAKTLMSESLQDPVMQEKVKFLKTLTEMSDHLPLRCK